MKVLKRIILAGIVLVLVLTVGAYIAVKIAFPPQKIKDLVHKHGSEALGRDVSVEDVSIRILPNLKVSVREINVANAPGFSADPCIKLRELALSINFLSLIRFSPVVNEIKLVEPEILYEVSKDGRNNLEGIGKADTAKAKPEKDTSKAIELPAGVALKSFLIENGRVRYRDMHSGRELTLDKINQVVSVELDPKLSDVNTKGKLEISEITVKDSAFGLRKGNIRVAIRHDIHLNLPGERLQVKALELGFQDIRATVKGEASRFMTKPPVIDFSLSAPDVRLASVLKEVPAGLSPDIPKLSAKGVASLQARVKGTLDSGKTPDVSARVTVQDGGISHKDLAASVDNLNIELTLDGDSLHLARLALDMGGNPVSMDALVTGLHDPAPMLRDFNLNALVDLGKLVPLAQKMAVLDKDMKAAGLVRARIKASGPLDPKAPQNLKASGDIDLKDVTAETKAIPKPVKASGQVKVDNDKIAEDLKVKIGESDVSVSGTVQNYLAMVMPKAAKDQTTKAKILVKSALLNLDEILPTGAKKKEEKEEAPMTKWPTLPKLEAEIDAKLARTQFMNLAMTDFSSHSSLVKCQMNTDIKAQLYTGGFTTSVKANLCDTSDALIAMKMNVIKVEANDFISRLNDNLPRTNRFLKTLAGADSMLFGKFSLDLDVKTHGMPNTLADNLTGLIKFDVTQGKLMQTGLVSGLSDALGKVNKSLAIKELDFSKWDAVLEAVGGKLLLKHLDIDDSPVGSLAALGSVGFDNSLDVTLEQHLPPALSGVVTGAGSALTSELAKHVNVPGLANANLVPTDKSGRAILYFAIGGLLTSPSFSLDTKRMATEGAGGAKAAVEAEARKKLDDAKAMAKAKADSVAAVAKAKLDEEKEKAKKKAGDEAKKQGKKVLKGLGL